jgi:hypothetical protein
MAGVFNLEKVAEEVLYGNKFMGAFLSLRNLINNDKLLDKAGKAFQGQTPSLFGPGSNVRSG